MNFTYDTNSEFRFKNNECTFKLKYVKKQEH